MPKTVDNDLPITDCCPGFGSVAKYVAVSIREAGFDVASMAKTSTKVFILEVMGRHAGWIAAAAGSRRRKTGDRAAHHPVSRNHVRRGEVLRARARSAWRSTATAPSCVSEGVQERGRQVPRPTRACATRSATRSWAASRRCIAQLVQGQAQLQVPLGRRRLPAARGAPHRLEGRRRAGLRGRQGRGRARAEGPQLRDADDRAHCRQARTAGRSARRSSTTWRTRKRCCRATTSRRTASTSRARPPLPGPLIAGEDYPPYKDGLPHYVHAEERAGEEEARQTFVV